MRLRSRLWTGLIGMVAGVVVACTATVLLQLIEMPSLGYIEYTAISYGLTGFLIGFVVGRGRAMSSSDAQPTEPIARRFRWRVIPVIVLAALGLLLTAGGLSSLWVLHHSDDIFMRYLVVCYAFAVVVGVAWFLAAVAFMRSQRLYGWTSFSSGLVLFVASYAISSYQERLPQYCWLVFGPESHLRLLVCKEGKIISIDRDGKRVFSGSERVCENFSITDPQTQTTYAIAGIRQYTTRYLTVTIQVKGSVEWQERCNIELASDPNEAKEAHFHEPRIVRAVMHRSSSRLARHGGSQPNWLYAETLSTNAEDAYVVRIASFPSGVHPVVDIEFPPKQQGMPPIKCRYPLAEPC